MAKDPAFLFYSKDWLEGTAEMTPEEKGVYIDLLAHQHQKGDLPPEPKRLAKLVGLSELDFTSIWFDLGKKFKLQSNNRLVNRKLTELMTERSEKGRKNKIIGTLASVVRLSDKPYDVKYLAKKNFDYTEFWDTEETELTEKITEWFTIRLKSIVNENEDGNANEISKEGVGNLWFLKFYHANYEHYKSVFNGQSTTEIFFKEWKVFIDFIYKSKLEDIFECKFLAPHDFATLLEKNKFTKEKWDKVLRSILSTGIKPEHNLFYRIPKFLEYENKNNGEVKQTNGTTKFNAGAINLLNNLKGENRT